MKPRDPIALDTTPTVAASAPVLCDRRPLRAPGSSCSRLGLGLLASLALAQLGCYGWVRADAGFTTSTTLQAGRQGAVFGYDIAVGKDGELAMDMGLHVKVTGSSGDVGASLGVLYFPKPQPAAPYVLAAVNLLQMGSVDKSFSIGLSPMAEAGVVFAVNYRGEPGPLGLREPKELGLLTLGTRIQYDVRYTPQPNEGYWSFNLGWAFGTGSK